jgi:hypothetical protein
VNLHTLPPSVSDPHSFSQLDPDPHLLKKLEPDPHSLKKMDPDPHKVNADMKPCLNPIFYFLFINLTCERLKWPALPNVPASTVIKASNFHNFDQSS